MYIYIYIYICKLQHICNCNSSSFISTRLCTVVITYFPIYVLLSIDVYHIV